jgi:hypothetical protein
LGGLRPRGRLVDAWAARRTGNAVDHQVRRADQPVLHRARRLERPPFLPQRRIDTTATLGEHGRAHNMCLGALHVDLADPTRLPHREVGPESATDLCLGAGQLMVEECQRPDHSCRDGRTSPRRGGGEALGARAVHGGDQGRPRQRLGSWAKRRRVRDEVCHWETWSPSGQPRLEVAEELPGRLS